MAGKVRSSTPDTVAREGDYEPDYRGHYETTYGSSGAQYETYSHAYQFGERMASQEQYRGRNFVDVEPNLRREYETSYPGSSWEKMKMPSGMDGIVLQGKLAAHRGKLSYPNFWARDLGALHESDVFRTVVSRERVLIVTPRAFAKAQSLVSGNRPSRAH
jgi:hypothetical protein